MNKPIRKKDFNPREEFSRMMKMFDAIEAEQKLDKQGARLTEDLKKLREASQRIFSVTSCTIDEVRKY